MLSLRLDHGVLLTTLLPPGLIKSLTPGVSEDNASSFINSCKARFSTDPQDCIPRNKLFTERFKFGFLIDGFLTIPPLRIPLGLFGD